jgi:hypothetical protein
MSLIGVALLVALCIPIVALVIDSPIGRALASRLDRSTPGTPPADGELAELRRRVELLEGELETLQHTVSGLHEENEFLQQMLEAGRARPPLPPGDA